MEVIFYMLWTTLLAPAILITYKYWLERRSKK